MISNSGLLGPGRVAMGARLAMLALGWWLLTAGSASAWVVGGPAIIAAALLSTRLTGTLLPRPALTAAPSFAWLFLSQSVVGGVDVARRTLAPRMRIQPGFARYPLSPMSNAARVMLLNAISLLPGTLAVRLVDDAVELHLLDVRSDPAGDLRRLEQAVTRLFPGPVEHSRD